MIIFRNLVLLILISVNLNAAMTDDVVFVENKDKNEISLKDEFINQETEFYTLSIGTLTLDRHDPIDFFRTHNLTNAVAYKFGDEKEFARVISGVYKTGTIAKNAIKNLDPRLQKNKPYSAKLKRHQKLFQEYSGAIKSEKVISLSTLEEARKTKIKEMKHSIYIQNSPNAKKLKEEFLNDESESYSIALGSMSLNKNSIQDFFNTFDVSDKALAHIYGKNRDKVRVMYGVYKTREDALLAVKNFNKELKENAPYPLKMSKFQSFYKKSYPDGINDEPNNNEPTIELKINDKKKFEKTVNPKLSDDIKILKPIEKKKKIVKKELKPEIVKPKNIAKIKSKPKLKIEKKVVKRVIKKTKPRKVIKESINKSRFVKHSKLKDVYFLESKGSFNILNEVFLNSGSSFYTVDLGEIKLKETTVEKFFIKNSMEDDALAYKYGDNKEYARVIYGAFETKNAANNAIKGLNAISEKELKISNIKNHQKLYNVYHDTPVKKTILKTNKKVNHMSKVLYKSELSDTKKDDIVYVEDQNDSNLLKEEFFNRDSEKFTITLITFLKSYMSIEKFFSIHNLTKDTLAYPIGKINDYYRVIYGIYNSSTEAEEALSNLSDELRRNVPYITRVRTNQKKFESYENRNLEIDIKSIKRIEFR